MKNNERMRGATPWRTYQGADPELRGAADLMRSERPPAWTCGEQESVWRDILTAAEAKQGFAPRRWKLATGLGGVFAVIVLASVVFQMRARHQMRDAWRQVGLGDDGNISLNIGAVFRAPAAPATAPEWPVYLDSGKLRARIAHQPPGHHLAVVTPHLKVVVMGTRFEVEVDEQYSTVAVQEGRVRVETSSNKWVFVDAGEKIRSTDPRLMARVAPPSPAVASPKNTLEPAQPAPPAACASATSDVQRRECYLRTSAGTGLAAQNALYALAWMERRQDPTGAKALTLWQQYLERFPEGVFSADASIGVIDELLKQGRDREALEETARYQRQFSEDPRSFNVQLLRGDLLCQSAAFEQAQSIYAGIASQASVPLAETALFQLALCQKKAGFNSQALKSLQSYLRRFPSGEHASESRALIKDF